MTAKRTSRGKAAPGDAPETDAGPELEAAPPPPEAEPDRASETDPMDEPLVASPDAEDEAEPDALEASAEAADPELAEEAPADEALEDADPAALAADDPGGDADPDLDGAPEEVAENGEEAPADAPAGDGDPIRLHRRARHDETEELLAWLRAAPAGAPLTLDASEVENPSTPYILAIVAAARVRAEAGAPAVVTSPSPAFVDAFSDLGLFGDLMKMEIRA
ncbi:STAS domain-containing protein [Albimonas sp. CAU 1670]|uniref:STAS domain-containing protein n=1 Tax=Albimonas sp. CAU 1670 TaxID=3032599 RepID=UPI0023DCC9CC|nr:STAS domain-containing protein [Albimonas sp. CAU 1670]MDF2231129.1 STAS domain-containing protein [Albimonas sp. CAU 1670]